MDNQIKEVVLNDAEAAELADLASIWADLQLVEMSIHRWKTTTAPKDIYVRRALWEQAVVAYARCFDQSRRRKIPGALYEQMTGGSLRVHEETMRWRDKLVAHRVDKDAAWSIPTLAYIGDAPKPVSVRIRVDLPRGPEDDRMAVALGELAQGLKNRLWQQWLRPLEESLLAKHQDDEEMRSQAAPFEERREGGRFFVTIDPSGRLHPKAE
jgi:hypothetical protein